MLQCDSKLSIRCLRLRKNWKKERSCEIGRGLMQGGCRIFLAAHVYFDWFLVGFFLGLPLLRSSIQVHNGGKVFNRRILVASLAREKGDGGKCRYSAVEMPSRWADMFFDRWQLASLWFAVNYAIKKHWKRFFSAPCQTRWSFTCNVMFES